MNVSLMEVIKTIPEFLIDILKLFFFIFIAISGLSLLVICIFVAFVTPIILFVSIINKIENWLEEHLRREDKINVSKYLSPVTTYHQIIEYERNKEGTAQCSIDGENTQRENPRMKGDTSAS